MNPFRQIVEDTRTLVGDIRRALGRVSWRLTWWRRRRQIESEKKEAEEENVRRSVAASTKMCRECRALIPASASVCPECGGDTRHIRSGGVGRALSHAFPSGMSVSMGLITTFFALFLVGLFLSARLGGSGDEGGGPLRFLMQLDSRALIMTGANVVHPQFGNLSGELEPWRLLTATFLHAGILHLLFNTWALRVIGPLVEQLYGGRRMFVLYLVTGIGGNIVSLWWHRGQWFQVGASGAIFGMIGVAASYGFLRRDAAGSELRRHMVEWAVYGVVMGIFMHADNAAHIGGFLTGAAAALAIPDPHRVRGPIGERIWGALALLGALSTLGSFALIVYRWAGAA